MTDQAARDVIRHVQRRYDSDPGYEWERLNRHRTEWAVTLRTMDDHLPPPPARVLDCGGGPGRYAIELARRGYAVTLFDLSAGNLALAQERAAEAGVALIAYEHGTATDLSRFPDASFDIVLLMGPLYHLLTEEERQQVVAEAYRLLKPGGQVWASFIARYAPLRYAAARDPSWVLNQPGETEQILTTGVLPPRGEEGVAFVAYFAHPTEVVPLLQGAGFEVISTLGVEGVVSMHEEAVNALEGADWERWVEVNYRIASDPCTHGGAEHLLAVAVKPRWRSVLRQIVFRLTQAGVSYKVVGGASVALNGVPIAVKDVDIEMDTEGARRFQALFARHVVQPVVLCNSEVYRSYFGRFDLEGVQIEVMGDLHRREGDGWVPSANLTEQMVDLDGVPVRTAWLEEEVLAYIRRGRLERAAQCLPHCDSKRLLMLLRGEGITNAL